MRYLALATAFLSASSFLSAADPALLNLVMPDAQVVAGVNVAKAKTSPFGQFLLRQMPDDGDFAKFINASGFDPRRDLQEVLMATAAGEHNGLVAARGSFDAAKITALVAADGKHTMTTYNGAQLLAANDTKSTQSIAFFDGNFAVAGDLALVKAAIDRRKSNNAVSPQLAAKVAMYGAADAWTVSLVPLAGLSKMHGPGALTGMLQGDLLKNVTETSGSLTFDSLIHVTGELVATSDKDATALGDVVKFLASMIQTDGGEAGAPVATLVKDLTVSTDGKILKLALAIPEAQLESLIQSSEKQNRSKRGVEKI